MELEEQQSDLENGKRSSTIETGETPSKVRKISGEDDGGNLSESERQKKLYALSYFNVDPKTIASMLFNIFLDNMLRLLPGIQIVVLKSFGEISEVKSEELKEKVDTAATEFLKNYYKMISKLCDKYESIVSVFMTLPENFVLTEDLPQIEYKKYLRDQGITHVNIEEHQDKIVKLQSQILEEMQRKLKLEMELKHLSVRRKQLNNLYELIINVIPKLNQVDEAVTKTTHLR